MSRLSPLAEELVNVGRSAGRSTGADRERILKALQARLGDAALLASAPVVLAPPSPRWSWTKISAATLGVGLVVGALLTTLRSPPERRVMAALPARAAALSVLAPPSSAPLVVDSAASGVGEGAAPSAKVRVIEPATRASSSFAEEVALLSRAASDLHAGRARDALLTLDEHRRRFPRGALSEERRAARAQALCALGRRKEAEGELTHLARSAPLSPQAARARQLCDAGR